MTQGIANAGSGLGGLVLSNTTRLALTHVGVKYALIINGLISLVILVPAVALLRGRHKQVGAKSAPLQVSFLWHPGFVWVWLWGAFASKWTFLVASRILCRLALFSGVFPFFRRPRSTILNRELCGVVCSILQPIS